MKMRILWIVGILAFISVLSCQSADQAGADSGSATFKTYCVNCHGINGSLMVNGARDLSLSGLTLDERILVISEGRNTMTAFKNTLTSNQIRQVAKYTIQLADSSMHAK